MTSTGVGAYRRVRAHQGTPPAHRPMVGAFGARHRRSARGGDVAALDCRGECRLPLATRVARYSGETRFLLIMLVNAMLIRAYPLSRRSCRHITGGRPSSTCVSSK
jgi:hypothetical protein